MAIEIVINSSVIVNKYFLDETFSLNKIIKITGHMI